MPGPPRQPGSERHVSPVQLWSLGPISTACRLDPLDRPSVLCTSGAAGNVQGCPRNRCGQSLGPSKTEVLSGAFAL